MEFFEAFKNTTSQSKSLIDGEKIPIIPHDIVYYLNIYLNFVLCGIFSLFGLVNNIVNMVIFYKLGLGDSMSIGLMGLSVADFLVSLLSVVGVIWDVLWGFITPGDNISIRAIHIATIGWFRDIIFLCSSWCTTFLTIERCVCVVFPFKVKQIFTKARSIVIVVAIFIVVIGVHMPVFLNQRLEWTTAEEEVNNITVVHNRLVLRYSDNWPTIQQLFDIVNGAVIPIPSQVIVLLCVFWMIKGLKESSSVRNGQPSSRKKDDDDAHLGKKGKKESNLSSRERRLIKVVLLIAIILTICNVPRFMAIYSRQILPKKFVHIDYTNLYLLLWLLTILPNNLNASVNIFVYLKVNVRYRQKFKELFCKRM